MKHTVLTAIMIFTLAGPLPVFAEAQSQTEIPAFMAAADTETSAPMMQGMPMMHGNKRGHGMKQGGQHGGKKHGGGSHGKGRHADHEQAMQRLDMIEARLAKIEAMLEILMRR
jgi:hypothetical protein